MSTSPEFIDSSSKQRCEAFDALVEKTGEALANPNVVAQLGNSANRLQIINANAFLPNISHGVIKIPESQINSENVALLPAFDNDSASDLRLDGSFAMAGDKRIQSLRNDLIGFYTGVSDNEIDAHIESIINDVKNHLRDRAIFAELGEVEDAAGNGTLAATITSEIPIRDDEDGYFETYYHTKPIVIAKAWLVSGSTGFVGAVLGNEFTHVAYLEDKKLIGGIKSHAIDELYAYNRQYVIGNEYRDSITEEEHGHLGMARAVEEIREKHASPEAPFEMTAEIMMGMLQHGAI